MKNRFLRSLLCWVATSHFGPVFLATKLLQLTHYSKKLNHIFPTHIQILWNFNNFITSYPWHSSWAQFQALLNKHIIKALINKWITVKMGLFDRRMTRNCIIHSLSSIIIHYLLPATESQQQEGLAANGLVCCGRCCANGFVCCGR